MRKLIIMLLLAALLFCGCTSTTGVPNNSATNTDPGQQAPADNKEWWKAIDTSNGLYLVVCETGENEYKCTVLPLNDGTVDEERKRTGAKWMSEKEIKDILPWYKLPDDKIVIKPYTDPKSSYLGTEDKGVLLDKMEALFENRYKVGQQFRDAWERLKNSTT